MGTGVGLARSELSVCRPHRPPCPQGTAQCPPHRLMYRDCLRRRRPGWRPMSPIAVRSALGLAGGGHGGRRRVLCVACGTHALHDGFADTLYLLLPLWQAEFGLGYAAVGALRSLYTAAMAGLQLPAATIARRIGNPLVLAAGTMLPAASYLLAGASSGFIILATTLTLCAPRPSPPPPTPPP